jgi:hypothetical protein
MRLAGESARKKNRNFYNENRNADSQPNLKKRSVSPHVKSENTLHGFNRSPFCQITGGDLIEDGTEQGVWLGDSFSPIVGAKEPIDVRFGLLGGRNRHGQECQYAGD